MVEGALDAACREPRPQAVACAAFGGRSRTPKAERTRPVDLPAGGGRLVDEHDREPGFGAGEGGFDPRRSAADDEEIAMCRHAIVPEETMRPSVTGVRQAGLRCPSTTTVHS